MADYAFIKDLQGQIVGLWLRNAEDSNNTAYIFALLKKHQGPLATVKKPINDDLFHMLLSKNYRVVPNNYDKNGGCFVVIGDSSAPGE